EPRGRRSQDFEPDYTVGHAIDLSEVENPRIAARVHRFRKNEPAELRIVLGFADDDSRLVGHAVRRLARNKILFRLVTEFGVRVLGNDVGFRLVIMFTHEGLIDLAGTSDFARGGNGCDHFYGLRRRSGAAPRAASPPPPAENSL